MSSLAAPRLAEIQSQGQWFPQLDGIRAIAVTLVFAHHWTAAGKGVGSIGVQLFFVLSGFLITGILLRERQEVDAEQQTVGFSVKQFYARRFLRIFPLYYFCLAVFLALGSFEIRKTFFWHFFYLSNVLFFLKDQFDFPFAHFWSLAVEEQFYLFWPWMVLLCPRRNLPAVLTALIAFAPVSRLIMFLSGHHDYVQTSTMVWANFDTLGMGALIACVAASDEKTKACAHRFLFLAIPFCVVELAVSRVASVPVMETCLDPLAIGLLSVWTVWNASIGFKGLVGKCLNNPLFTYLGKISYGLYVWHLFAPAFVRNILRVLHLPASLNDGAVGFALLFAWTAAAASLTWFLFEKPINSLKRFFPYRKIPKSAGALSEVAVAP